MIYISKGRIEALNKCRRKYYYSYHKDNGWDASSYSIDLAIGIAAHKGLECLLSEIPAVEEATREAFKDYVKDWPLDDPLLVSNMKDGEDLAVGLVLGWRRACKEAFLSRYEILSIEREIELPISSDITLVARADATLRDRASGLAYVLNWKTTSEVKDWTSKWLYDIQMWTEALALEYSLGETIGGTIVVGLFKGVKSDGRLNSKFLYRYEKNGQISAEYKAGWTKTRVSNIAAWVKEMPIEVLATLFVESTPILKNDKVVEDWLKQIVRLENDVQYIAKEESEQDRLDYFTQSFSTMNCRGCPFLDVCMQRSTVEQLVEGGRLIKRTSPLDERNKREE